MRCCKPARAKVEDAFPQPGARGELLRRAPSTARLTFVDPSGKLLCASTQFGSSLASLGGSVMPTTHAGPPSARTDSSDLARLEDLNAQYIRSIAHCDTNWFAQHLSVDFLNSNPD